MSYSIVTLVNDPVTYTKFVKNTVDPERFELIPILWPISATNGLNRGIEKASCDWVICCHQDVSFPENFDFILTGQIAKIEQAIKNENRLAQVEVIGTFGRKLDLECAGRIYNPYPKLRQGHGKLPTRALTVDEHCIIINKKYGLRFDETLPYFHIYGADICLSTLSKGSDVWIIDSMLNHDSEKGKVDETFPKAVEWFMNKWTGKTDIPIFRTMCCEVNFETGNWIQYV